MAVSSGMTLSEMHSAISLPVPKHLTPAPSRPDPMVRIARALLEMRRAGLYQAIWIDADLIRYSVPEGALRHSMSFERASKLAEVWEAAKQGQWLNPERDPRINPRVGDKLRHNISKSELTVVRTMGRGATPIAYTAGTYGRRFRCSLNGWREISENTEIVKRV